VRNARYPKDGALLSADREGTVSHLRPEKFHRSFPDDERRGLIPAVVFLPLKIEQGIGSIGIEEGQLNCFLTRAIQELSIDSPGIGINFFQLTYTVWYIAT
jgi:hypothetical protein